MRTLELQAVDIQDVVNNLVNAAEAGDAMSSTGRCIGNVECEHRGTYSVLIIVTCDEDDFAYDDTLPVLPVEFFEGGKGVIFAPAGHLPSSETYTED